VEMQGTWKSFDLTDGLPHGVKSLMVDRRGALWIGAAGGLCRYDGISFKAFSAEDGLPDDNVNALHQDSSGRIWVGAERGGLCCLDDRTFSVVVQDKRLAGVRIQTICEDNRQRIWIGTNDGLYVRDGAGLARLTTEEGLPANDCRALFCDSAGRLWVGAWGGGVAIHENGALHPVLSVSSSAGRMIHTLTIDSRGRTWIGSADAGLVCLDGERVSLFATDANSHVQGICEGRDGRIWFATHGAGVLYYDDARQRLCSVRGNRLENNVTAVVEDRDGQIWFGNQHWGLVSFAPERLRTVTTAPVTGPMMLDRRGRLWFPNARTLCCLEEGRVRSLPLEDTIAGLLEDDQGRLWVCVVHSGVFRYGSCEDAWHGAPVRFTVEDGLGGLEASAIIQARDGTIWVGTGKPGTLCRFDGVRFEAIPISDYRIDRLYEDSMARIWIGSAEGGGLFCYAGSQVLTYTLGDGLPGECTGSLAEDENGNIWIGTDRGLCMFDGDQFIAYYNECSSLPSCHNCAAVSRNGACWFGTTCGGLYRYNGRFFQWLTEEDGLPSNVISALLPQADGSILVGTSDGIVRFSPTATALPAIEITEVLTDQTYEHPTKLACDVRSAEHIVFSFRGISLLTRRLRYAYQLEGFDETWRTTWNTQVCYDNLRVGKYTFKVRAINCDLKRSSRPATVDLTLSYASATSHSRADPVTQARDLIERCHGKISVTELARQLCVSQRHLRHLFSKQGRSSPQKNIVMARVKYAKALLATTDSTASAIALECGYETVQDFCRCFKRVTETTPSEYRERVSDLAKSSADSPIGRTGEM